MVSILGCCFGLGWVLVVCWEIVIGDFCCFWEYRIVVVC